MFNFCSYTFLTVLVVDLLATSGDIPITWTSPVLPKLSSNDTNVNPLGRPITQDEESWIGSLINIGAVIGPLPFGFLSEKFGRKMTLLCISIPSIISFLTLAFIKNLYWYYFARVLAGISLGAACSLLPLYIAEIAEDSNRGMLSVTLNIFWTFGNLIPYVLGPYMPILWFNVTLACVPALFFVLFLTTAPESPYYLVSKNEFFKAEEALMKLRSKRRSVVSKEIIHIQSFIHQTHTGSVVQHFKTLFKTKANLKALAISLTLISFQQLSGINAVLFYTQLIFEVSGSNLPAEISSIVIGLVLFFSSLFIPFFADSLGRRIFLMISSSGMMVSLLILGTYFFYKETLLADISNFQMVPILTLVLYIIAYNLGYGALPWTVGSELFPVNVKATGASMVSFTCWLVSFIVTKFFNDLNNFFGKAGTFWSFGVCCLAATLFTLFCVPETKGKSFREIQDILER